jgi:MoxR-like ATPase
VHVSDAVQQYAVALATATRRSPELRLGASPRATLHLVRAAKAWAAMQGREYVLPDDVRDLAPQVLPHRLLLTMEATMSGRRTTEVVQQVLAQVPVPGPDDRPLGR